MSKLPDFLIIPGLIINDNELQPLDGYVYGVVYWYKHQKLEKCIASNADIGSLLNASISGVSHSLTRLVRKNYIKVIINNKTFQREEILPLISFTKKEEVEILPSEPLHKRATPLAQAQPSLKSATPLAETSNDPSSNEQQNNINLTRIINNTVNVNGKKSLLKKLPNLSISKEEKDYVASLILEKLKDEHSKRYYNLVAAKVPEQIIREALSEIKHDGADTPPKAFTTRMEKYALKHQVEMKT